jgi:hypothetical protein
MEISEEKFESWCFCNGGETYDEDESTSPGLVCRFPDTDTYDRMLRITDSTFEIVTDGRFYSARSLHQHTKSWIDDDYGFHVGTALLEKSFSQATFLTKPSISESS